MAHDSRQNQQGLEDNTQLKSREAVRVFATFAGLFENRRKQLRFTQGAGNVEGSITVRQGTQIMPIVPKVMRKHPGLAARGLHVEHHVVEPTEFPERELLQHNIFLYTGPAAQAEIKSPEFTGTQWMRPGSLWIMPREVDTVSAS